MFPAVYSVAAGNIVLKTLIDACNIILTEKT